MNQSALTQQIFENLTTAVLWFDKHLRLQVMNPSAETMLEISANQAYGLKMDALLPETHLYSKTLQQVLKRRCPIIERGLRLHLSGARSITVDCSIVPLSDEKQLVNVLIELVQVDQHIRISREENMLIQQQAARNVVRGLAHEIKNPLGGLRGTAQLLERELPEERLREYTHIIIREADRLQTLLNRMLGPSTISNKRWMNVHEILVQVRQLTLSEVGDQIEIDCDFDPSIPDVWADSDQLTQAILNIMRNAAQAMEGKGKIKIQTRIRRQMSLGNRRYRLVVRIDIIDNGPGVPSHLLDQIFYPLVTGRAEGTGLGLSIAQTLINQHGGLIECSSQTGETIFTLWLPVEKPV